MMLKDGLNLGADPGHANTRDYGCMRHFILRHQLVRQTMHLSHVLTPHGQDA